MSTTDATRTGMPGWMARRWSGMGDLLQLTTVDRGAGPTDRREPGARGIRALVSGRATPESAWLLLLTGGLLVLGLVMTFSASFVQSTATNGDAFYTLTRQAIWAAIGVPVAFVATVVDYRRWRPFAGPAVTATLVGLVLVLMLGEEVNGARRWFAVGPLSVQPAEIIKLTLPIWCAHVVARKWGSISRGDVISLMVPALPVVAAAAVLVAAGPDLESAVLVGAIGATVVFVAGLPLRLVALTTAIGGVLAWWSVVSTPYRVGRFAAWMDPTAYADTFGYQTTQGFIALGSGGWFGVGLGQGRGKWLYIPNADTDFIFAIVGEELGLIGALVLLLGFAGLALLGIRIAMGAADIFGRLLAASITAWLVLQASINISSVVGVLPVTGVTLPLVSFGGSSLLITMAGVGLLASVARHGRDGGARHGRDGGARHGRDGGDRQPGGHA